MKNDNEKALSTEKHCIILSYGVQVWIDEEQLKKLIQWRESEGDTMVEIQGQLLTKGAVKVILTADKVHEATRRMNGEYQCQSGEWHEKFQKCDCATVGQRTKLEEARQRWEKCAKCNEGWVDRGNTMRLCVCQK